MTSKTKTVFSWVSKSEIKRDAEELKRLGAVMIWGKTLDKIPLDADLRAAIEARPAY